MQSSKFALQKNLQLNVSDSLFRGFTYIFINDDGTQDPEIVGLVTSSDVDRISQAFWHQLPRHEATDRAWELLKQMGLLQEETPSCPELRVKERLCLMPLCVLPEVIVCLHMKEEATFDY